VEIDKKNVKKLVAFEEIKINKNKNTKYIKK